MTGKQKITLRIPTQQYGYCEVEITPTDEFLLPYQVKEMSEEWERAFVEKPVNDPGLPQKQWNEVLDEYLWRGGSFRDETYSRLSKEQLKVVNEIRKSKGRANYKVAREELDEVTRIKNISN